MIGNPPRGIIKEDIVRHGSFELETATENNDGKHLVLPDLQHFLQRLQVAVVLVQRVLAVRSGEDDPHCVETVVWADVVLGLEGGEIASLIDRRAAGGRRSRAAAARAEETVLDAQDRRRQDHGTPKDAHDPPARTTPLRHGCLPA